MASVIVFIIVVIVVSVIVFIIVVIMVIVIVFIIVVIVVLVIVFIQSTTNNSWQPEMRKSAIYISGFKFCGKIVTAIVNAIFAETSVAPCINTLHQVDTTTKSEGGHLMNHEALQKLSYGLFILTTNYEGRDNGCIIDTAIQSSSDPITISLTVDKKSLTCEMLQKSEKCTISVIGKDADIELFRHWGYQSGRQVDKLKNYPFTKSTPNGTLAITNGTNAYLSINITTQLDLGSHILFIGTPIDAQLLTDTPSMTYINYTETLK